MGTGKTLTATALAYTEHVKYGRRILANYHLNFPHTFFDYEYFLRHLGDEELNNCITILDEAALALECRSNTKLNRLFTYYIVQTRKRYVDLYLCTQHIDMIDKRARRAPDVRGTCRYRGEDPCGQCSGTKEVNNGFCGECGGAGKSGDSTNGNVCPVCLGTGKGTVCPRCLGYGVTGWATTRLFDLRTGKRTKIRVFGPAFWGLYDTTERVPFTKKQVRIPVEDL